MPAAHEASGTRRRSRSDEWYAVYYVDESVVAPPPQNILVVDDVLTAGAHFVAIKRRLRERFPSVSRIIGCFYARRAVQAPSEDE
jgi:predicted amidophosphoribosyltransferase